MQGAWEGNENPFCSRSRGDTPMHVLEQHTEKGKPGLWLDTKRNRKTGVTESRHTWESWGELAGRLADMGLRERPREPHS